jgi:hypothetical protein
MGLEALREVTYREFYVIDEASRCDEFAGSEAVDSALTGPQ